MSRRLRNAAAKRAKMRVAKMLALRLLGSPIAAQHQWRHEGPFFSGSNPACDTCGRPRFDRIHINDPARSW